MTEQQLRKLGLGTSLILAYRQGHLSDFQLKKFQHKKVDLFQISVQQEFSEYDVLNRRVVSGMLRKDIITCVHEADANYIATVLTLGNPG